MSKLILKCQNEEDLKILHGRIWYMLQHDIIHVKEPVEISIEWDDKMKKILIASILLGISAGSYFYLLLRNPPRESFYASIFIFFFCLIGGLVIYAGSVHNQKMKEAMHNAEDTKE